MHLSMGWLPAQTTSSVCPATTNMEPVLSAGPLCRQKPLLQVTTDDRFKLFFHGCYLTYLILFLTATK